MLKLFYAKESRLIYTMEALGVLCLVILIIDWWPSGKTLFAQVAFYIFILLYLCIRAFATFQWYGPNGEKMFAPYKKQKDQLENERNKGIDLQFKKAMVPTSYIIPVFGALLIAGVPDFILYFADILLAIIIHVNIILIYFYIKDKETLPVNYFTRNQHL